MREGCIPARSGNSALRRMESCVLLLLLTVTPFGALLAARGGARVLKDQVLLEAAHSAQ